ncbi:serine protease [Streptomyces sp. NPDC048269]|uniref:serine protease n=1 Tax=Streptomyces sp. NPDC048269 TaxID=3155753 RepID=UPI003419EE65
MTELVTICDFAGRARGSGFVADDRGTVVTSHEAVDGLSQVVLHGPGPAGRTWLAQAGDVTALPGLALALVRTDGLGVRPLPVATREAIAPGTYVRLPARGWRQARVLGGAEVTYPAADRLHAVPASSAVELAIGTDGRDALSLGGEACGGPVLDAETGAVLGVLGTALRAEHRSGGFAVTLRAAAGADPAGPLAALLERNAATVPAYGPDLNLAGVLELTRATLGASLPPAVPGREPVERPGTAAELEAFTAGDRLVLGLVGAPGTGRTTALAALAVRRARGTRPAPTVWLRGADLRGGDASLADAVKRALVSAARLAVAARPEHWERAGALCPPEVLYAPARPARRMPPALPLGDLTPAEAATARARLGIPEGAVREPDGRHPLTLGLLAGIRAAEVTAGRPGRDEVFDAHLDLMCLRAAVRIAAARAGAAQVHGPGVRRLAARVAGRVHEAARRCLGHGQGALDRASFEELFPWRTGWASAVLTEGLLVPAGPGYRFAHEELSDWIQAGHLDVPTALDSLVHRPAGPDPVPRHRIGPVLEALRRLPADTLRGELMRLVHRLNEFAEAAAGPEARPGAGPDARPDAEPDAGSPARQDAGPAAGSGADRIWWATRLLRESLLRAPDAHPHLPVLHALAEHVARAGPGEFGGWFWNRLRLPEPDRLDLLRRLLPADPADAAPGDRYLDAAARRLTRDPRLAQPLLCAWFTDGRRLRGRPGATVATAAQALLHTHRRLALDDLTEALVTAADPHADELLSVLAEEEPPALCRAVDRWAHDERPARRAAAAAYGMATAPHVRTPADRELLRYAAQALLARPADAALHGSALAVLLRDPQARGRHLPAALACFRAPEHGSRLPAAALVAALPVLPDPDAVFDALRARADGEVVRALAALTTPALARRAADLVRDHLAGRPEDAPHAASFVDRRLEQGAAAAPVLRRLVLDLLRSAPAAVRAELASVLAAPGGEPSCALRGELADVLLREETDPWVLDSFLVAVAAGTAARPEGRTRELLRRTGRRLFAVPGGPAVFERRTLELARSDLAFGGLVAGWMAQPGGEAAALLGPSARRTVETLGGAAPDVT